MTSVEDGTQTTETQQPSWHVQAPQGPPPLTPLRDDIPTSLPPQESLLSASYVQPQTPPDHKALKIFPREDLNVVDSGGREKEEEEDVPAFHPGHDISLLTKHGDPSLTSGTSIFQQYQSGKSTTTSALPTSVESSAPTTSPSRRGNRATWVTHQDDDLKQQASPSPPSPPIFPASSPEPDVDELDATVSEIEVSRSWQEAEDGPYVESPESSSPQNAPRPRLPDHSRPVTQLAPNVTHPSQFLSPQKRVAQPITSFSPRTLRAAGRAAGSVEPPDFTQKTRGFLRAISAPVANLDPERDSFGDESNDAKRLKPRQRLELLTAASASKKTISRSRPHDKVPIGKASGQNGETRPPDADDQDRGDRMHGSRNKGVDPFGGALEEEHTTNEEEVALVANGQKHRDGRSSDNDEEDVLVSQASRSLGGEEVVKEDAGTPVLQPTYINSSLPAPSQIQSDPLFPASSSQDQQQQSGTDPSKRFSVSDDGSEIGGQSVLFSFTPRASKPGPPLLQTSAASYRQAPTSHFGNLPSSGAPSEVFPSQIFDGSVNGFGYDDESQKEVQMAATQAYLQPTYSTQKSSDTDNAVPSHSPNLIMPTKPTEPGSASTAGSRVSNIPANRMLTRRSRPPTEPAIAELPYPASVNIGQRTARALPQQAPRSAPLPTISRFDMEPTQVSQPATLLQVTQVDVVPAHHTSISAEVPPHAHLVNDEHVPPSTNGVNDPIMSRDTAASSSPPRAKDVSPPQGAVRKTLHEAVAAVLPHVRTSPMPTEVDLNLSRPSTPTPRERPHLGPVTPKVHTGATYQNTFRSLPPPPDRPTPTKQYGKRKLPSAGNRRRARAQSVQAVSPEAVETVESEELGAGPKCSPSSVANREGTGAVIWNVDPDRAMDLDQPGHSPLGTPVPVPRQTKRRARPSAKAQEAMDLDMLSDISSGSTPPPPEDHTYHPTPKNGRKGEKAVNRKGKARATSQGLADVSEEESEGSMTIDDESISRLTKHQTFAAKGGKRKAAPKKTNRKSSGGDVSETDLSPTTEEDSGDNTYRPAGRNGGPRQKASRNTKPDRGRRPPVEADDEAGPSKRLKPNVPKTKGKGKTAAKSSTIRNLAQRAKSKSATTSNADAGPSRGRSVASTEMSAPPSVDSAESFISLPVLAYWHGQQRYWFAGTAVGYDAKSGMIQVEYADGFRAEVTIDLLRLLRFNKGDQIRSDATSFPNRNVTVRVDWTNNIAGVEIIQEERLPSNRIPLSDLYVMDKVVQRDWQDRIVAPQDLGLANAIHLARTAAKNALAGNCFLVTVSGTGSAAIRRELEISIEKQGGRVVDDWPLLFDLPHDGFGSALAAEDAPFLVVHGNELAKPKMVAALASGIPCIASKFVEHASQGADWRNYLVSPGFSVLYDQYTSQLIDPSWGGPDWNHAAARSERQLFTGKRFLFVIPSGSTDKIMVIGALVPFCLHALGAASMDKIHKFESQRNFANYDYILIEDREIKVKIPDSWKETHKVCNFIWLKQCIINGSAMRPELMREGTRKE